LKKLCVLTQKGLIGNNFLSSSTCSHHVTRKKPDQNQPSIELLPLVTPHRIQKFQQYLLLWFRENGRDLPWRHTQDPYKILVSEMMLHQTQVDRVVPKYQEFLGVYPTFEALAAAKVEDVQDLWRPLGYNFRPGRLHQIAQYVVTQCDGKLPDTIEGLMALSGIGRYTAGAILSFAFQQDAPILDTNAQRILQRYFDVSGDPFRIPAKKQLWYLAERVIPSGKGYVFNQALLDFGAIHCKARNPSCEVCGLNRLCPFGQLRLAAL
jgi:A/G-specific adenine glycosylase